MRVGLAAASGAAAGTLSGPLAPWQALPDVPAAGLKGPVPAPCPHPGGGEAAPLKGAAPVHPSLPLPGLALLGRADRGAAGALKGTGKESAGKPTSPPRA